MSDSAQRASPLRTNSEDHGSLKAKDQSQNQDKDKAAGKKSSDSGEEADKDFILIWVRKRFFEDDKSNQYIFVAPAGPFWPQSKKSFGLQDYVLHSLKFSLICLY